MSLERFQKADSNLFPTDTPDKAALQGWITVLSREDLGLRSTQNSFPNFPPFRGTAGWLDWRLAQKLRGTLRQTRFEKPLTSSWGDVVYIPISHENKMIHVLVWIKDENEPSSFEKLVKNIKQLSKNITFGLDSTEFSKEEYKRLLQEGRNLWNTQ